MADSAGVDRAAAVGGSPMVTVLAEWPSVEEVSTRNLIIAAVLCGLVILAASAIQFAMINS